MSGLSSYANLLRFYTFNAEKVKLSPSCVLLLPT